MGIPAPLGVEAAGLPPLGDQANAVVAGTFVAKGPGKVFAFRGPMNLMIWASVVATLTTTGGSTTASVNSATGLAIGAAIKGANVPLGTTIGNLSGTTVTLALPTISLDANANVSNAQLTNLASTAGLLGATVTASSNATGVTLPANTTVLQIITAAVPATANSPGVPGVVLLSNAPTQVGTQTTPVPFDFALTGSAVTGGADAAATFTGVGVTYSGTVQVERSFDGAATWLLCNVGGAGALAQYTTGTPVSITFGEPEKDVYYRLNCIAYTSGTINYRISQTGGAAESLAVGPLSGG